MIPARIRVSIVVSLCACLMAGCLPSLHPLYTEDVGVFREELLGRWRWLFADHQGMDMNIESIEGKAHRITVPQGDEEDLVYVAHLIELGGQLYLECQLQFDEDDLVQFNVLPLHQIMRIRFDNDRLITETHNEPWLEDYLSQHPDELDHLQINDRLLITAHTEQLQQFFIAHADDWTIGSEQSWNRRDANP